MQGLVLSLRSNGFMAYVPAFDAKGPVYISDRDGQVQVRADTKYFIAVVMVTTTGCCCVAKPSMKNFQNLF